jgi:ABC-type sugar transport system substrate-binding protein
MNDGDRNVLRRAFLVGALSLQACAPEALPLLRSRDGKVTVIDLAAFSATDPASQAALDLARAAGADAQIILAFGADTARSIAAAPVTDGQPAPVILAVDHGAGSFDGNASGRAFAEAIPVPSVGRAAAEAAILLGKGASLPQQLLLPGSTAPGEASIETLRAAHAPSLDHPRREGRPLVLGCVWTAEEAGTADPVRRDLRARCAEAGAAVRLIERSGPHAAGDIVDLVALGADAIIIQASDATPIAPAVRAAGAAGVPTVALGGDTAPGFGTCVVRLDAATIGRTVAQRVIDRLGDRGGAVILVRETSGPARADRLTGSVLDALGVPPGQEAPR